MSRINLLPEDLRKKEEKELARLAKKPKVFEINLSNPKPESKLDKSSDKPKKFFWRNILGKKKKKDSPLPPPMSVPPVAPSTKVDLLSRAKKQKFSDDKLKRVDRVSKPSFWSKAFGRPRFPVKPASKIKSAALETKPLPPVEPIKDKKIKRKEIVEFKGTKVKTSFWRRLFGRFRFSSSRSRQKKISSAGLTAKPELKSLKSSPDLDEARQKLSREMKDKKEKEAKISKPKRGWWKKFKGWFSFGSRPKKIKPTTVKDEKELSPLKSSFDLDKARDEMGKEVKDKKEKEAKISKPKRGWWKKFKGWFSFGSRPKKIKPTVAKDEKELSPLKSSFDLDKARDEMGKEVKDKKEKEAKTPKSKRSWWKKFKGWFSFGSRPKKIKPTTVKDEKELSPLKSSFDLDKARDEMGKEVKYKKSKKIRTKKRGGLFGIFRRKEKTMPMTADQAEKEKKKKKEKKSKFHLAPKTEKLDIDINLMPQELVAIKYPGSLRKILAILASIILPGLIVYGVYLLIDEQQKKLDVQIIEQTEIFSELILDLNKYQDQFDQKIKTQKKLLVLKGLLDDHIYWSNFFDLLEDYTLDGVYYTDLTIDVTGTFVLPAVATNYQILAEQLFVLQEASEFIAEVQVDSIKLQSGLRGGVSGVSFDLKIILADGVLSPVK